MGNNETFLIKSLGLGMSKSPSAKFTAARSAPPLLLLINFHDRKLMKLVYSVKTIKKKLKKKNGIPSV